MARGGHHEGHIKSIRWNANVDLTCVVQPNIMLDVTHSYACTNQRHKQCNKLWLNQTTTNRGQLCRRERLMQCKFCMSNQTNPNAKYCWERKLGAYWSCFIYLVRQLRWWHQCVIRFLLVHGLKSVVLRKSQYVCHTIIFRRWVFHALCHGDFYLLIIWSFIHYLGTSWFIFSCPFSSTFC